MIIYHATKKTFLDDALHRDIEEVISASYKDKTGGRTSPGEIRSWKDSLLQMAKVLYDEAIPSNAGVAIEYRIPQTSKRVDVIVSGHDDDGLARAVIVELKQWSTSKISDKDGLVIANRGGTRESEGPHPSYQAWTYASLLESFNEAVQDRAIGLRPCAYLHNYVSDSVIDSPHYADHLARAPLFLKGEGEREKLRNFIKRFVKHGDDAQVIYDIEAGRVRPSKMLVDSLDGMLRGNEEFVLIDDQKVVFENALHQARLASKSRKRVVIVQGGPGTGKSVVAINLLVALTAKKQNCRYVSKNAAPRAVFEHKLTGGQWRRTAVANLFSGSGAFIDAEEGCFDTLVVDEAHRLNAKSGLYGNLGDNQVKEIIQAANCSIFFVDDDQRVTLKDVGDSEAIRKWASKLGASVLDLRLESQFRCNGSDGYIAWLDNTLEIRPTANELLDPEEFDFRVLDSPAEVHQLIEERNRIANRARVVAGYCWNWVSKRNPDRYDIEMPHLGYRRRWNLGSDGSLWIVARRSVEEVGCIHTCQGLELDYVGVLIGPDLRLGVEGIETVPTARASSDQSLRGYRKLFAEDPVGAKAVADRIVKNTYRTLMTRGMKGCYVYCVDKHLAEHLRQRLTR